MTSQESSFIGGKLMTPLMTPWPVAASRLFRGCLTAGILCFALWSTPPASAQDDSEPATVTTSVDPTGMRTIVLDTRPPLPPPPVFYSASSTTTAQVGPEFIDQSIQLTIKVLQGKAKVLSFGFKGGGQVTEVKGDGIQSWSVRQSGKQRFLDLQLKPEVTDPKPVIKLRSPRFTLPTVVELPHLGPGDAVGFDSIVTINYAAGVEGSTTEISGFAPLATQQHVKRFQTATGGNIKLSLNRDSASPAPVELVDTTLQGTVHADGDSVRFQLQSTAVVTEPKVELTLLAGNAALVQIPKDDNYQVRLAREGKQTVYKIRFSRSGTFPIKLEFVAKVLGAGGNDRSIDFTIAASAVVPITLDGLSGDLAFHRDQQSVVPLREKESWLGFLPASGRVRLQWKRARTAGEGKLFFTTSGRVEARVGAGLLRQDHFLNYQVLQGELNSLNMILRGPGEILDVQGNNIVAWKVSATDDQRQLDITLSQPVTDSSQVSIRSQTPLGPFPVRMEGLRLEPTGTIRHSGFLRLTNLGSVRLEPTGLAGLTQLAPEQFPGEALQSRQVYVYRFPAASHSFTVAADRIQPEVNVSELLLYQLAETDRVIKADIELDIREAPIREWDFSIPADYSVVSVTGASVADYITASEETDGRRNLKVIFGQDVSGRQLVSLHLEKSEPATAGDWTLPRIRHPEAKAVRGDIGIIGAPGFRIAMGATDLLVEKPLSYFPNPTANLQQAFRIREPDWSATMQIELLDRSVQSDVFHLYSLSQETVYGSALINYFITGAPVSELRITLPQNLKNEIVDGQDVQDARREGDTLIVSLHQPVMGAYTLLVTFDEKPDESDGTFSPGQVAPLGVQGERGYVQVVSPMQVEIETVSLSEDMLSLDPLELPAEFQLLSTAPPLGTWQYTERPFDLKLKVEWFQPGTTVSQVIEFSEANSRVSQDGELVTNVLYYVKSRGRRTLKIKMPPEPVRLWEVTVNGQPVTARKSGDTTLIPLPGGTDPNNPVEVRLRLGKPAVRESRPDLMLPVVLAPVLKTQWSITGDDQRVLVPAGGTVTPPVPVLRPSGFDWLARRGIISLFQIIFLTVLGIAIRARTSAWRHMGLIPLVAAIYLALATAALAFSETGEPVPLLLSLPILSAGEVVQLDVYNTPIWRVNVSSFGLFTFVLSITAYVCSRLDKFSQYRGSLKSIATLFLCLAVLLQGDGAPWFFLLFAAVIFMFIFLHSVWDGFKSANHEIRRALSKRKEMNSALQKEDFSVDDELSGGGSGTVTAPLIMLGFLLSSAWGQPGLAADPSPQQTINPGVLQAVDSIQQNWQVTHADQRLTAKGTLQLSGKPGDRFLMLKSPAVLTHFEAKGLRLTKTNVTGQGMMYVISIPTTEESDQNPDPESKTNANPAANNQSYSAVFEFQLEAVKPGDGIPVPTGDAAVQKIELKYDQAGWDILCPTAVRIESIAGAEDGSTQSRILLGPGQGVVVLKPKARDVTMEDKQFFVEASNLYLPGPGVVDGRHRLNIRPSQGQVSALTVDVPPGLTVSEVTGPVGSWQFDADVGRLTLEITPAQSTVFDVTVETQRGLDPLPAEVNLSPLKVVDANGQVGLVAIAFGPDAQPEKLEPTVMSAVNLGDFDASLNTNPKAVLHRVYRYGVDGGEVKLLVAPVASEVRVISKQVLSLGDERIILAVNFSAEISRAGLFQLSFTLPTGLEVESLTSASLHHWAELSEDGERQVILHLNGKTLGLQEFALTLTGNTPTDVTEWDIPHFELKEATRQTGDLIVRPTTGIRLRTISRQNISETDPRAMGGKSLGALAFRLLQRDWKLVLGIEKLEPRISGNILQEITLREGQTRSAMIANFKVQNASIRSLQVILPITDADEIKTLRAIGETVSDFVRVDPDNNLWEVQFKRRILGPVQFRIEYERRGDRSEETETLRLAEFPQAGPLPFYFAVRAGGRLEIEPDTLSQGWQRVDWNTVPINLRDSENRNAPVLALKAQKSAAPLAINVQRHSLADSLKLRVANGNLTTVLSPNGDQLTAVDVTMEVIQRSSLSVGLPPGGELFSIFVNGESVSSIRVGGDANAWQFYILPGIDDRTANVRFVYTAPGQGLSNLQLGSPQLNVPLENIEWSVVAPKGMELTDNDGNLELVRQANQEKYDKESYLSKIRETRQLKAQQAANTLEQANQFMQAGEQTKANWAFNSVANQYGLDAASNEDARVQLENLQTQQAIVGLNTRRQRLFLDNNRDKIELKENDQLRQAAADNPILQQDQLNFQPQELSQLLRGNSTEDNAILQQIAGRLVQHQRTTEPAPQAIIISLPEEGEIYTFSRSVQVAENAPLELDVDFESKLRIPLWQTSLVLFLLAGFAATLTWTTTRKNPAE